MASLSMRVIIAVVFLLTVHQSLSQEIVLQDGFSDKNKFLDLSKLLFWHSDQDTLSAFELVTVGDANDLQYQALSLKDEAIGEGGYNSGSAYASTCIDYQLPLYNRHFDTLTIEFDYLSNELSGSGESGRLGIVTMYEYPREGPQFNDVHNQEKSHPFGRPAYNLRILNKTTDGNGAYLFYGGGQDELGEFEKTGDQIWLPGFISGPGGFSPGQKENYPIAPVLETTSTMVSDQLWQHYTWMITPSHLLVYTRQSAQTEDKNVLRMDMLLPEGNTTELITQLNDFYQTNIDQLPEFYHFFDRIEALRFYFRSIDNGYLANLKVSKTNHFEPATIALTMDTLQFNWNNHDQIAIPLEVVNPANLEAAFKIRIESNTPILTEEEFELNISEIDDHIILPIEDQYSPDDQPDTIIVKFNEVSGWLSFDRRKLVIILENETITAFDFQYQSAEVYPTPFTSRLYFNTDSPITIRIFNSNQQLVEEVKVKESVNLGALSPGVYYVQYAIGDRQVIRKLFKK